jgi:hypothetical protein
LYIKVAAVDGPGYSVMCLCFVVPPPCVLHVTPRIKTLSGTITVRQFIVQRASNGAGIETNATSRLNT